MSPCSRGAPVLNSLSTLLPRSSQQHGLCRICARRTSRHATRPFFATSRPYAVAAPVMTSATGPEITSPIIANLPDVSPHPATSSASPVNDAAPITEADLAPPAYPFDLETAVILSRPPLLTKAATPFEAAFYLYQKRLNERLTLPFSRFHYFKERTPMMAAWRAEIMARGGVVARDTGGYDAYADDAWADEVLVGDRTAEEKSIRDAIVQEDISVTKRRREEELKVLVGGRGGDTALVKAAEETEAPEHEEKRQAAEAAALEEGTPSAEGATPRRRPLLDLVRVSEGDADPTKKRIDRRLDETVYLVVQNEHGQWQFPSGGLMGKESLRQAAQRILTSSFGPDIHTWLVGNAPAAHQILPARVDRDKGTELQREKRTFFMRGRIMAGEVVLQKPIDEATKQAALEAKPPLSLARRYAISAELKPWRNFKWLARDELKAMIHSREFAAVKGTLADR